MANIQLAKNLLYLRTLYNLKQDDIANLFNITRQACSNYEKSTRTPDLDVLASFAAYFHVTLDQLILHDLKAEGFTADSAPSSVMMESKTPYMQGIEKNTGNYIYLTEEGTEPLFLHSVLPLMNSVKLLPAFLILINDPTYNIFMLMLPIQIHHEPHSLLFQYLLPEPVL